MMEELYKVMDDLLDVEFQMKSGIDLLKELEEFYLSNPETEASEARKLAVLIKGYLQSMKSNIREIIRYIDDTTLEKSNEEKKDEQEAESTMSEKVQEFVNLTITEHTGKAYSEWKLNQDKEAVSEIDKKYQELLETLSPEQEEVITEYCNAIFSSGAEHKKELILMKSLFEEMGVTYAAQCQAGSVSSAWRGCRRKAGAATSYSQKSRAVSKFSQ